MAKKQTLLMTLMLLTLKWAVAVTPITRTRGYRLRMRVLNVARSIRSYICAVLDAMYVIASSMYNHVSEKAEDFALQCLIIRWQL